MSKRYIPKGPFTLKGSVRDGWDIVDQTGYDICRLTACLIDGSGRSNPDGSRVFPDGVIVSREERRLQAAWVAAALNTMFKYGVTVPEEL